MKKGILAFVSGFFCCALLSIPIISYLKNSSFEYGKSKGYVDGVLDSAVALEKEFGSIDYSDKNFEKVIFSIKTTEVVLVKVNGVKTIKVTGF